MASHSLAYAYIFSFICFPYLLTAQQPYGESNCPAFNNATSDLGYACNGVNRTCQSFLIYLARPAYNTVSSIASLLSTNASQVSAINNNIAENMALATSTELIVPVTCSCAGRFYQANTSYVVQTNDNYYVITNSVFDSLTTCNAIQIQKVSPDIIDIFPDERLNIPLRCACPTRAQVDAGIRYLMTVVVQPGNTIGSIAQRFGADIEQTFEANEKSEQDDIINPETTLLIPLQNPPNSSQMEYRPYALLRQSSLPSTPPTVALSHSTPGGSSNDRWVEFGAGIVAGAVCVSVAGSILIFMVIRKSMREKNDLIVSLQSCEAREKALAVQPPKTETESLEYLENISKIASLKLYTFKDLQAATENFSADHWIKGSVYNGTVNGDLVAIKKIDGDFSKEISVLNKINHFNLIRLLGFCFEDGVWYFIYEYASNGPLNDWICNDNPGKKILSWGKRVQVACDVATGLNYLHSYTIPPHVHKDIKSSNVLLNDEFRGKIANFGLSRPVRGNDGLFTFTNHIVGTKGYLAPEYLENGIVSPMLDVYAFGVLLLEMLTGKDITCLYEPVNSHLSEILTPVLSEEDGILNIKDFIDPSLGQDYPADIAYTMLVLVGQCLRKDPGSRPSMDEIVQILSKTLTTSRTWGSSTSDLSLAIDHLNY